MPGRGTALHLGVSLLAIAAVGSVSVASQARPAQDNHVEQVVVTVGLKARL